MNIGFIGTGSMGAAMVPNLVAAGHSVCVWNRDPQIAKRLDGVTVLSSVNDAFQNDAVITMLSDDAAVREVSMSSKAFTGSEDWSALAKVARRRAGLEETQA